MSTKSELYADIIRALGGDVDDLPDNLKSTYWEAIILKCGGTVDDLPDRLKSTYLKRIVECIGNGGGGGSSGIPDISYTRDSGVVELPDVDEMRVVGTCSGYFTGGTISLLLLDERQVVVANHELVTGDDSNNYDVDTTVTIPSNAKYFVTSPSTEVGTYYEEWNNYYYTCNLTMSFNKETDDGDISDITYTRNTGLIALPNADTMRVVGTCSGYQSGGDVCLLLLDEQLRIVASRFLADGADDGMTFADVDISTSIPSNAKYFIIGWSRGVGTYVNGNEVYGYTCDLTISFDK